ncbi:DUF5133 domain-containing protein [Streptomyces showdoensis]|uniref:DUF5133 domain-containing protein n=1 Tax=Streptomyces showdoensis TaxID=68268 RepID=A0A2P2GC76_STREW|nr:DUF5133 domain-containing protein [Streptomyces showdoensis]KKZ69033.1 hypothetical protein VO63_36395 [Streptomyces showdoensis]
MLLPDRNTIDRLLRSYRAQERKVLSRPCDPAVRRRLEDTSYTLCVLMGVRSAHEAVHAAEHYLATPRPAVAAMAPGAAGRHARGPVGAD